MSCPHEIGDKIRFRPSAFVNRTDGFGAELRVEVTGTVVQIHEGHRWYRAAYETPQGKNYECFKF